MTSNGILRDRELRDLIERCDQASDKLDAVIKRDLTGGDRRIPTDNTVVAVVDAAVADIVTNAVVALVADAAEVLGNAAYYLSQLRDQHNA
jgi:hypothetical protein